MNELGNIFKIIEDEKVVYQEIKSDTSHYDKLDANLTFNYYLYSAVYAYLRGKPFEDSILRCLISFIIKEPNLNNARAVIDNNYQILIMQDADFISKLLMGRESNFAKVPSDAAKLGALLALNYKVSNTAKLDSLRKALLLTKNVI